ncbi:hypothetical protein SNEBB_010167 [Seison nebaliae]|nr:hypothetical protein SNEBB_010167 [Seison nebaliae]
MYFSLIFLTLLLCKNGLEAYLPPLQSLEQSAEFVKNIYKISWTSSYKKFTFELQIDSRYKWFGFGLSPNGGMKGSDIFVVETIDGKLDGQDYFSPKTGKPIKDRTQNYKILRSDNNGQFQRIVVERDRLTCDVKEDLAVTIGRIKCIYAYGTSNLMTYHSSDRGTVGLPLFNPKYARAATLPKFVEKGEYRKKKYQIPGVDTTYHCSLFKADLKTTKDYVYIYRTEAILPPETKEFLHHFILYFCPADVDDTFVQKLKPKVGQLGGPCFRPQFNPIYSKCSGNVVGAWAVGGELIFDFPPDVAYRLDTKYKYFMLETHFDNPGTKTGFFDTSGMALYYGDEARKFSAGTLAIGANVPGNIFVPPKVKKSTMTFPCSSECTKKYVKKEGINVFTAYLHSHLTGVSMKSTIVRDGREVDFLGRADTYDFDYQDFVKLQKPVKILPGDELRTECTYSTNDRNRLTKGGLSTHEEMCLNLLYYYPADDDSLRVCTSSYAEKPFVNYGEEMKRKNIFPNDFNMTTCMRNIMSNQCDIPGWENPEAKRKLADIYKETNEYFGFCTSESSFTLKDSLKISDKVERLRTNPNECPISSSVVNRVLWTLMSITILLSVVHLW